MTVAKSYVPYAEYVGDGTNTVFASSEGLPETMCEAVQVYLNGTQLSGTAYGVEWRESADHRAYAEATLGTAPALGDEVRVITVPVMEQQQDFANGQPFNAGSLEEGYDLAYYQVKYLNMLVDGFENIDAKATTLPTGATATARFVKDLPVSHLLLGLPRGEKGEKGESVKYGTDEVKKLAPGMNMSFSMNDGTLTLASIEGGTAPAVNWGSIGGTITNQTDLKNQLDAKLDGTALTEHNGSTAAHSALMAGKADANLGNVSQGIDFVVEYGEDTSDPNNYMWYRKYRSGWLEQGGKKIYTGSASNLPIFFLKAFANTNYHIVKNMELNDDGYGSYRLFNFFELETYGATTRFLKNVPVSWYACGWASNT